MTKLQEKLIKLGITIRELSLYEGVEDESLMDYIEQYEKGKDIPEGLKKDFDFILNNKSITKLEVIHHLMIFEQFLNSSEEKPFIKKFLYYIRTDMHEEILLDLKKHHIEYKRITCGVWLFSIFGSNICLDIKLFDERLINQNDDYRILINESLTMHSFDEMLNLFYKIKGMYINSITQMKTLEEIVNENEKTVNSLNSADDEDYEIPPFEDLKEIDEMVDLLEEISSMIKEIKEDYTYIDPEQLKKIKELFLPFFPKYKVEWEGKKYAIIKRRKDNVKLLCTWSLIYDASFPQRNLGFMVGEKIYYPIKEGWEERELYEMAQYLDNH